jgi:hypothetical protein
VLAAAERAVAAICQLVADLSTTSRSSSSNGSLLDAGEGSTDEEPVQAAGRAVLRSKSRGKSQVVADLSGQAASAAAVAAIEAFGDNVEVWRRKVHPSAVQAEVVVVSKSTRGGEVSELLRGRGGGMVTHRHVRSQQGWHCLPG